MSEEKTETASPKPEKTTPGGMTFSEASKLEGDELLQQFSYDPNMTDEGARQDSARSAFKQASLFFHPDKNDKDEATQQQANQAFIKVKDAYEQAKTAQPAPENKQEQTKEQQQANEQDMQLATVMGQAPENKQAAGEEKGEKKAASKKKEKAPEETSNDEEKKDNKESFFSQQVSDKDDVYTAMAKDLLNLSISLQQDFADIFQSLKELASQDPHSTKGPESKQEETPQDAPEADKEQPGDQLAIQDSPQQPALEDSQPLLLTSSSTDSLMSPNEAVSSSDLASLDEQQQSPGTSPAPGKTEEEDMSVSVGMSGG